MTVSMPSAPYCSAACASVEPDGGDLGVGVGDPRDARLVDRLRREAGDLLGDEDALLEAAVGQLQAGHDVADGEHAVEVGAAALVGQHEAALHRDALLLVPEAVGDRPAADGDEQQLGLDALAALDGDGDAVVGGLDARNGVPVRKSILRLRKARSSALEDASSSSGDQAGQRLDDRDVGAEALPDAGELAADDAAAEHDHRRGHPVEPQRVLGGDDPLAVDLEAGQRARVGAGGQHDVLAGVRSCRRPRPCWGPVSRPSPSTTVMPRPLIRPVQALEQPGDDAVLVGVDAGHVDAVERRADAELLGLAGGVGDLGRVQQRLGGDAADVQAGAAELALLDQADASARAGRPAGRRRSRRSPLRG